MKYLTLTLAALTLSLGAVPVLTPCAAEDSTGCYWNAGSRSNGQGQSFLAITEDFRINY